MNLMKNIFMGIMLCNGAAAFGQAPRMEKFEVNTDIGYAQAIKVGNTIYVSGTVGWGNMQDALRHAYSEIERTLKNYKADFQNVVKENVYTTQLDSLIAHKDIRREFYKNNNFPAATWTQVARLYSKDFVVEIEVVAVLNQ